MERLEAMGLSNLVKQQPKLINRVFAMPKGGNDRQRLSIDAQNASMVFVDPQTIELTNPGHLAHLHVPAGHMHFTGKSDMDNQYHRMQLPPWMRNCLVLPKASIYGRKYYLIMRPMPTG